jgi:hypothetical protein
MSNIKKYIEDAGLTVLDDNKNYKNRFEVKSETSESVYVIAQTKKSGIWTCSCFGFRRHRHCKHLDSIKGLIGEMEREPESKQLEQ